MPLYCGRCIIGDPLPDAWGGGGAHVKYMLFSSIVKRYPFNRSRRKNTGTATYRNVITYHCGRKSDAGEHTGFGNQRTKQKTVYQQATAKYFALVATAPNETRTLPPWHVWLLVRCCRGTLKRLNMQKHAEPVHSSIRGRTYPGMR